MWDKTGMFSLKGSFGCMFLIIVLVLAALGSTARADTELRMTYPGSPEGVWGRLSTGLAADLKPDGVTIETFPEHVMGGSKWALDAVRNNIIDLAFIGGYLLAQDAKALNVLNLPMLATDLKQARAIVAEIGPELASEADKINLDILAYTWVVGTFISADQCVVKPDDLRGAKVIDGPRFHQMLVESVGGVPLPLPFAEIFSAMQSGLSNTGLFTIPLILDGKLNETTDCITDPSVAAIMLIPVILVINKQVFDTLSPENQKSLKALATMLEEKSASEIEDLVAQAVKVYVEDGKSAQGIEGEALTAWRSAADKLNETLAKEYGVGDLYQKALKARDVP